MFEEFLFTYVGPVLMCDNKIYRRVKNKGTGKTFTVKWDESTDYWFPTRKYNGKNDLLSYGVKFYELF